LHKASESAVLYLTGASGKHLKIRYLRFDDINSIREISGSHGGEYKNGCRLGCCAVLTGRAIALMVEAASTGETSINLYHNTRCNNPEDSHHKWS
jgi:hypothetical protein